MDTMELAGLLEIPAEVKEQLAAYESSRHISISAELGNKLLKRDQWEEGLRQLQEMLGEDPTGVKILWELLHIAAAYSHGEYEKRGIADEIFVATMKFCTRFLQERYNTYRDYNFVWAWWFPRQISLNEYRNGALEYEFVDGENREIAIHIPSDADMSRESVARSLEDFRLFRHRYYPEWADVDMTCDTWMLMPELKELLGEDSNILAFQNLFEIDRVDYDATWYMGWIYPGVETIDEGLPEGTTLQRSLKKYLLAGKKFGAARGHLA